MQQHKPPADAAPAQAGAWYRQPVLWLGAAILIASLAGCVWMIVLGAQHADVPVEGTHSHSLLDMPMHAPGNGKQEASTTKAAQNAAPGARDGSPGRGP